MIDVGAWEVILGYEWQGNIRELINVVQRFLFIDDRIITPQIAKRTLGIIDNEQSDSKRFEGIKFSCDDEIMPLKQMEKTIREKYFLFVRRNSSSDTEAAKKLGLAPPNYYRMAKELGLK